MAPVTHTHRNHTKLVDGHVAAVGRIIHVVNERGECRAAMIVRVWDGDAPLGYINASLFPDGSNDGSQFRENAPNFDPRWLTSIAHERARVADGATPEPFRWWHWPEMT